MSISLVFFVIAAALSVLAYFLPGRRILCGAVLLVAVGLIIAQVGLHMS